MVWPPFASGRTSPFDGVVLNVAKGAKPEAADLEQSFRSAPEAAVHVITR
jgi:hypothetical protein